MSYDVRIHFRCDRCGKVKEESHGPILEITLPWNYTGYVVFGSGAPVWYCSDTCLVAKHQEYAQQEELRTA